VGASNDSRARPPGKRSGNSRSRSAEHGKENRWARYLEATFNLRDDDLQQELGKFVGINSTPKWTNTQGQPRDFPGSCLES
jgi:hypothetical protein